jgi:predicted Fe-Mo cluster-binding NifX family protein
MDERGQQVKRMVVCVAVNPGGFVDRRWGRAEQMALADVGPDGIESWREVDVGWGRLREPGREGYHHARVARFLREHRVDVVVANRMGRDMEHMLGKLGIQVRLGAYGPARQAVLAALDRGRGAGPRCSAP